MEGITVAKTSYLDESMMEKLLKDVTVKNSKKLVLDNNGNIVTTPKETENIKKTQKDSEEQDKNIKNDIKNNKKGTRWNNFMNDKKGVNKK